MSARTHDATVALVSHIPQLIAYAYASSPEFVKGKNTNWTEMASTGFDTSTRLASSESDVWLPILTQNKEFVVDGLRLLSQRIEFIAESICCNDTKSLKTIVQNANNVRKVFDKNQIINNETVESTTQKI